MYMPVEFRGKIIWLLGDADSLNSSPEIPFHPLRLKFINDLSKALLADPIGRSMPDVATFAFWCRRGNLERVAASQKKYSGVRLGLGLVFHISPANVPINFAYSLIFAFVTGNSSILRLSSGETLQEQLVLGALRQLLVDSQYASLQGTLNVVRYGRDDRITEHWLQYALGRVVWGGDETVAHIRSLRCHPRSREVAFTDRYSMGIVKAVALLELSESLLVRLCDDLFNDIFLFHQKACSSPHLIVWVGSSEAIQAAQCRLWLKFEGIAGAKYSMEPAHAMDKFVGLCDDVLTHENVSLVEWSALKLARVKLAGPISEQWLQRGAFGTLHEWAVLDLDAAASVIDPHVQTVTSLGFTAKEIEDFVIRNRLTGVDRVVPFGRALDMGLIWDGFDMVSSLSRLVEIQL